jgi:hypothetical protein
VKIKILLLAVFSASWILPLCLAVAAFRRYLEWTLIPQITGRGFLTSFPFLQASFLCFAVACCWLAAVIVFWVVYLMRSEQKGPDSAVTREMV